MASCEEPHLLPIEDALARMRDTVEVLGDTESLPLSEALDRILARSIKAPLDVPAHDNSAMDGYALRADDSAGADPLKLIGTALAGHAFAGEVKPGTCVRIMTGAPVPKGADCVVMQENTSASDDAININQSARKGENIRRRGEDINAGTETLAPGKRLGPVDIALLASQGFDQVDVYRRLRVAVLSTGDELTPPGQALPAGHVYDSNRYGIIALLQRLAVEVVDLGPIPDQPEAIAAALKKAGETADAVVSSGGVSVGDADYVKDILDELGQVDFWKVAIRPGKPFAFGKLGKSWFFGLPGNPVSTMVTLHQLALPVLRQMAGEIVIQPPMLKVRTATTYKKRPGRSEYQRARLFLTEEGNRVGANRPQGSGVMTSFSGSNCYVVLEQERGSVAEGEEVNVLPFDRYIS